MFIFILLLLLLLLSHFSFSAASMADLSKLAADADAHATAEESKAREAVSQYVEHSSMMSEGTSHGGASSVAPTSEVSEFTSVAHDTDHGDLESEVGDDQQTEIGSEAPSGGDDHRQTELGRQVPSYESVMSGFTSVSQQ